MEIGSVSPTPASLLEFTPEAEYESRIANLDSTPAQSTTEYFSWRQLTDLSQKVPELTEKFGTVTASHMGECVALGTDSGAVVIVDYLGRVKTILGGQANAYGPVSSLSFSADYASLVVGYAQGFVAVWDWSKRSTVTDSSSEGILFESASLPHGSYECQTDEMGLVAVLTSGSLSVFRTRDLVERQFRISYQQPAPQQASAASSASASMINTRTAIKRSFLKRPYAGSVSWLPALKYKQAATATDPSESHYSLPRLVYSWGPSICVLSLILDNEVAENGVSLKASKVKPRVKFERTLEWTAIEDVVFCRWVGPEALLYMTQSQRIFVFEIKLHQETEVSSSPPGIIAGRPWVTLATGTEAEPSYAQVMSIYKRRIFAMCGSSSVYTGRLLSWSERLGLLVDQGQFIDAITLATGLYQGDTGQVVVGLPRSKRDGDDGEKKRRKLVGGKLLELMRGSLRLAFEDEQGDPLQSPSQIRKCSDSEKRALISVCIEACLATDSLSLLFGEVYECYSAEDEWQSVYLETIEPFILSGRIQQLPPQILNAMIERYGTTLQRVRRLGEILMNLNLAQGEFDIDRVLSSCQRHGLWRTFARVWLGMGDPIAPIKAMISAAADASAELDGGGSARDALKPGDGLDGGRETGDDDEEAPQVVIFDYLDMIVCGRYYPDGKLIKPQNRAEKCSTLVTELILPPIDTSHIPVDLQTSYSTFLALLDLDAERLLLTLRRILNDPFTNYINLIIKPTDAKSQGTIGRAAYNGDRSLRRASQVKSLPQIVVDTLYVLSAGSSSGTATDVLSKRQIGLLSSFALTLYASRFPLIFLRDNRVSRWTDVILELDDPSTLTEREYAFELLFRLNPPHSYSEWIDRVRSAGFFRVLESIYMALGQYADALQTYLDHPDYAYHRTIFAAIRELASTKDPAVLARVAEFVRSRAVELVEIDADHLVGVVESVSSLDQAAIFGVLENSPQAQFAFLRALLDPSPESLTRSPERGHMAALTHAAASDERAPPDIGLPEEQHIVVYPFQNLVPDNSQCTNVYPQQYHERYIELLCQFSPSSVVAYLKDHADLSPEPFRLSFVQTVCDKYGVADGLVWALVRLGDFSGALETLLTRADQEMENVKAAIPVGLSPEPESEALLSEADKERLVDSLDVAAQSINACVEVCKAALVKLGRDVAAQSAQSWSESSQTRDAATKAHSDYRALVGLQLCDLWLALLRRVLGYLHSTGQSLDNLPLGSPAATRSAWLLVSKRERWMLHGVLDVLISTASPASSLISLRHIIQQLLALGSDTPSTNRTPNASARSLGIAEIQHLLAVAVSAYKSEARLVALTNILVDYDLFTTLAQLVRSQKQGWLVSADLPSGMGAASASSGALSRRSAEDHLCCAKCSLQLFVDRRQERVMAEMRKQVVRYFDSSSLRVMDLHVFEDPAAQWQWIKLRSVSASYDDLQSSKSIAAGESAAASQHWVVLFKCGHGYHKSCLTATATAADDAHLAASPASAKKPRAEITGGGAKHDLHSPVCLRCAET
ncbi:hypothetical protein LPJ53_004395 [Coemansia erecta]|uniref:Vacuolar protein sorting-associated protein 8 central domain-containing protein n=1 Tax=Coemansia erecta TaxID=147472 RepID=A0A9W7XZ37_9FUNG|nr:hypothetical protein LPJ53_004395 [Coemansia erecta]